MVLRIQRILLNQVIHHARIAAPVEACGVLVGKRANEVKIVENVVKARNVLVSSVRYAIDPEELFCIFTQTERSGQMVVGFYHSHPSSNADFSQFDRSSAHYSNCSYLVYSNKTGRCKSFLWNGEEEEFDVIESCQR